MQSPNTWGAYKCLFALPIKSSKCQWSISPERVPSYLQATIGNFLHTRLVGADFPRGPGIKNLPTNSGDTGFRIWEDSTCPRVAKPVCYNYWAQTLQLPKPGCPRPMLCNKRSQCSEKPMHCNKNRPCSPPLEKAPCTATKTQNS